MVYEINFKFNKDFKGIEIVLFHIVQSLLDKLNKTNEDWVIGVNIYWKRYPLHHIPPAKLCYILIVWHEVKWLVGGQKSYGQHSTSERNNNTVDFGQKENFLFFLLFFQISYNKIIFLIIAYNKNMS